VSLATLVGESELFWSFFYEGLTSGSLCSSSSENSVGFIIEVGVGRRSGLNLLSESNLKPQSSQLLTLCRGWCQVNACVCVQVITAKKGTVSVCLRELSTERSINAISLAAGALFVQASISGILTNLSSLEWHRQLTWFISLGLHWFLHCGIRLCLNIVALLVDERCERLISFAYQTEQVRFRLLSRLL